MKPLVSIIMPCFNAGRWLAEALESCLEQTYSEIEICCVNDGSTDNTSDILEQFAKKDARLRFCSQANSGLCDARNQGVTMSRGDYFLFLDADDTLVKNAVDQLLETILSQKT